MTAGTVGPPWGARKPGPLGVSVRRAIPALSLTGQGRRAEALPLIEQALRLNASLQRRPAYTAALEAALGKPAR